MLSLSLCSALLATSAVLSNAAKFGPCPLAGPDYLAPTSPSTSDHVRKAKTDIERAVKTAIANGTTGYGKIDTSVTSFSLGIYSTHEKDALFTFNHDAPKLAHPSIGVKHVDSNTIYRIGSISKLLSVYVYLASVGDLSFHDPVTKYIPEFADYAKKHHVDDNTLDEWDFDSMTVGALATQLSGMPRETRGAFFLDEQLDALPLPHVPMTPRNISGAECHDSYHIPCTRESFLANLLSQKPVGPAFHRPAYSNTAYGVMGLILEKITGQALPDLFKSKLVHPLNLNATYYAAPPTPDHGIIPFNNSVSYWTANIANLSAAGNYYSSVNDMAKIGKSILTSQLLPPAMTRRWLKPATFADRLRSGVGAPWEIYEAPKTEGKESWMFIKQGDIGTYSTTLALLPDQDMVFTVLAAGLDCVYVNQYISDIVAEYLAPASEAAAKEQTRKTHSGTYEDKKGNSKITLHVDDKPGIAVSSWTANGTNMEHLFGELLGTKGSYFRLYPSGLTASKGKVKEVGYKLVAYSPTETYDHGAVSTNCFEWTSIDALPYGDGYGLDDFVVVMDGDMGMDVDMGGKKRKGMTSGKMGMVKAVKARGLGMTLMRTN